MFRFASNARNGQIDFDGSRDPALHFGCRSEYPRASRGHYGNGDPAWTGLWVREEFEERFLFWIVSFAALGSERFISSFFSAFVWGSCRFDLLPSEVGIDPQESRVHSPARTFFRHAASGKTLSVHPANLFSFGHGDPCNLSHGFVVFSSFLFGGSPRQFSGDTCNVSWDGIYPHRAGFGLDLDTFCGDVCGCPFLFL